MCSFFILFQALLNLLGKTWGFGQVWLVPLKRNEYPLENWWLEGRILSFSGPGLFSEVETVIFRDCDFQITNFQIPNPIYIILCEKIPWFFKNVAMRDMFNLKTREAPSTEAFVQ